MADDYRTRCADAAMRAFNQHAVLCEHTQQIPIGALVDAMLAERDDELEQARHDLHVRKIASADLHKAADRAAMYGEQQRRRANDAVQELSQAEAVVEDLTQLVRDLADPTPCSASPYGGCHAHGWQQADPPCPHARARDILTAQDAGESRG